MSIGPAGLISSLAGLPASARANEADRAKVEAASAERQLDSKLRAESAAEIGATDGDEHQTEERDADGRRLWELPAHEERHGQGDDPPGDEGSSRTVTGLGGQLDLSA